MKQWFQSKTIWSNIGIFFGAVGTYLSNGIDLKTALLLAGGAALNTVLRMVTSTPIGDPTKP